MNRRQANTYAMYQQVIALFQDMPAAWEDVTPIVVVYDKFEATVAQITEMHEAQVQNRISGATAEKNALAEKMLTQLTDLKKRLRSYAVYTENTRLLEEVNISNRQFNNASLPNLIATVNAFLALAEEHRTAAADFKITPAALTALRTTLNELTPLTGESGLAAGKRMVATASLKTLFTAASRYVKHLNDLVDTLVEDQGFVARYRQARKVTDRRGRSEATSETEKPVIPPANQV